jgi:RNA polymerase sigma factor (TIGR02999 family)
MSEAIDITTQLHAARAGDAAALDALFPIVYEELKSVARRALAQERAGHTLQPTALVHEAYLRLAAQQADWSDRRYFFAIAASMMRRILVNHARDRAADKRGGGVAATTLSAAEGLAANGDVDVLELHAALEILAQLDERQARVVELKFFGGLEIDDIADVVGVSPATVRRDWALARMWLGRELAA